MLDPPVMNPSASVLAKLWYDIETHPRTSLAFAGAWSALFAYTFIGYSHGMPSFAFALHLATPLLSGSIVGWWRSPAREGFLVNGWKLAGAPLSGALVAVLAVSAVFLHEAIRDIASRSFGLFRIGELVISWFVAALIFAAIASVLALVGGAVSAFVARAVKKSPDSGSGPA